MNTPRQDINRPKKSIKINFSFNIRWASKAEVGGTKKNKVDVWFALLFWSNHIKIKKAPSETAKICHDIAKRKSFEKFIKKSSKQNANSRWKVAALNACKKLFPDIDKLEPVFFCQIIAREEEISPITPAKNAIKVKSPIRSEIIIIDAPLNPKNIPIHWNLVRVSFKKHLARKDVRIGCNETINAIRVAEIPLDNAKNTPPKYKPWNNKPLIDASINALNEIFLFFEKKIKNKNKNNATKLNLIDRERNGGA